MSTATRRARAEDLPALAALARGALETVWTEEALALELERPMAEVRVLEEGGALHGFALTWRIPPEASLLLIAVDHALRRRGLGRRLLVAASASALEAGCERMVLEVSAENAAARALYAAQGFEEIGRRAGYYVESGADALVLSRALR